MLLLPLLLLLFATTITSWIPSNRKIFQHIRTTNVPLISSGRSTYTTDRFTPSSTAFCGSNSDNSDVDDPLQEVQQKIRAVEYCLDNFGNITLPGDADKAFIQLIRRYKKFKVEDDLVGLLKDLQGKETKLLPSNTATVVKVEGTPLSIPEEFNFNVASWKVGDFVDCKALSEAMRPFGGFPSTLLVREEMKMVWSIVLDGITNHQTKWVIVGSPGVGKSVLTVLLCFHLARSLNMPVFLARQLKGEPGAPQQASVAICVYPGGRAVGYPKQKNEKFDMKSISAEFGRPYDDPITVLDGWSQRELAATSVGSEFGGFDVLATSAQYVPKGQDTRHLVVLPAWKESDLRRVWSLHEQGNLTTNVSQSFEDQISFSGGSVRELFRAVSEIRFRIKSAVECVSEQTSKDLLSGYGGSPGAGFDSLRRCYLSDGKIETYTDREKWQYVVDSAYALKCLSIKAPLSVYEQSLKIAESCGPAHYGWSFEALVHQLFRVPNMAVTFNLLRDRPPGAATDEYESIIFDTNIIFVERCGANEAEALEYLVNLKLDARGTYWHPDFSKFPVIDAILWFPFGKTVYYIQATAAQKHDVNSTKLALIHKLAKEALKNSTDWKFKYVAITPSPDRAKKLVLYDGDSIMSVRSVGEVSISKGHITYTAK